MSKTKDRIRESNLRYRHSLGQNFIYDEDLLASLVQDAGVTPEEDVAYTIGMITIPVMARPELSDDEPTPEQASIVDQAIAALNESVGVSEQAAEQAEDAAATAQAAADRAAEAAAEAAGVAVTISQNMLIFESEE